MRLLAPHLGPLSARLRCILFRSSFLARTFSPGLHQRFDHFRLKARHISSRAQEVFHFTSGPSFFPVIAASAVALSLCDHAFCDAQLQGITWPTLLQHLRDAQDSLSIQSGFTAVRRPLDENTDSWSFHLTFPISDKADIYSLLTTLAKALASESSQSPRMDIDESPTRTVLTVSHDAFQLEVSVPRLGGFDSSVAVELLRAGPDAKFSQTEVDALIQAYAICQTAPQHEGGLLDGKNSVDYGPRTILDRDRSRQHPSIPYDYKSARPRAWDKLLEMGVEVFDGKSSKLTWDALAGYEDVKKRVDDTLTLPLKHPQVYDKIVRGTRERFESNLPKAILYEGPPGCGKTLSAKILAASIGVPFVHVPLETILSKYYGETTKKLADILQTANELGKCVVFIDECDSIGLSRNSSTEIHEVTRRTLSVLLRHIDGMDGPQNSILLAATNHKEDIDPALMSRFDVVVSFPLPDMDTRAAILALYAKHLSKDELRMIAQDSYGFSGRELLDLCEEAERTHGGSLVRNNPNSSRQVELPTIDEYLAALRRKAPHVVGRQERTRARIGRPAQSLAT
ncbi:AAA+ ATPase [Gracilaria domingensis]|nr:AAA+ ATPase [Gracilaria domingensis]